MKRGFPEFSWKLYIFLQFSAIFFLQPVRVRFGSGPARSWLGSDSDRLGSGSDQLGSGLGPDRFWIGLADVAGQARARRVPGVRWRVLGMRWHVLGVGEAAGASTDAWQLR